MINLKIGGIIVAAFVAGAFVASPELRAYAANTVFSSDIVDGEVKSIDIGNGEVTSQDLATSAVTNSKIATDAISTSKIGPGAVTNSDIGGSAVTTGKIKDGQVMSADIAQDAVGASEIQGVTKLIFDQCIYEFAATVDPGVVHAESCAVIGTDTNDKVLATLQNANVCFVLESTTPKPNEVVVDIINVCSASAIPGSFQVSIMVYDK